MQAKRIVVAESNDTAGLQTAAILSVPLEPREEVNFHNIWLGLTVEPQDAAANCQGTWVLYVEPDTTAPLFSFTDSIVNLENRNNQIVACGVFSASNESPFTMVPVQIKTSRNLEAGSRLIMSSTITGITAGAASNRVMLCAHVTRK